MNLYHTDIVNGQRVATTKAQDLLAPVPEPGSCYSSGPASSAWPNWPAADAPKLFGVGTAETLKWFGGNGPSRR